MTMKDMIIKQAQVTLSLLSKLPDIREDNNLTDKDFEAISVYMGETAEFIEGLGGDING